MRQKLNQGQRARNVKQRFNQRQRAQILLIFSVIFLAGVAIAGILCHDAAMETDFSRKNMMPCLSLIHI